MHPLRPHVLALTITAALALTGCAATTTSPPPSPTPHTPHTITPPSGPVWPYAEATEPPQMQRVDSAGACAFAEYALRFIPEDLAKGRSQRLEEYSSKDCEVCRDHLKGMQANRLQNGWIRGQQVIEATLLRIDELADRPTSWVCEFRITTGELQGWMQGDEGVTRLPESTYIEEVFVSHSNEGWQLLDMNIAPDGE